MSINKTMRVCVKDARSEFLKMNKSWNRNFHENSTQSPNWQIGLLKTVLCGLLQLSSVRLFIIRISWDFWIEFVSWWQLTVCFHMNVVVCCTPSTYIQIMVPFLCELPWLCHCHCLAGYKREQFSNWCIWRCWKLFASMPFTVSLFVMLATRAVWILTACCLQLLSTFLFLYLKNTHCQPLLRHKALSLPSYSPTESLCQRKKYFMHDWTLLLLLGCYWRLKCKKQASGQIQIWNEYIKGTKQALEQWRARVLHSHIIYVYYNAYYSVCSSLSSAVFLFQNSRV